MLPNFFDAASIYHTSSGRQQTHTLNSLQIREKQAAKEAIDAVATQAKSTVLAQATAALKVSSHPPPPLHGY